MKGEERFKVDTTLRATLGKGQAGKQTSRGSIGAREGRIRAGRKGGTPAHVAASCCFSTPLDLLQVVSARTRLVVVNATASCQKTED